MNSFRISFKDLSPRIVREFFWKFHQGCFNRFISEKSARSSLEKSTIHSWNFLLQSLFLNAPWKLSRSISKYFTKYFSEGFFKKLKGIVTMDPSEITSILHDPTRNYFKDSLKNLKRFSWKFLQKFFLRCLQYKEVFQKFSRSLTNDFPTM